MSDSANDVAGDWLTIRRGSAPLLVSLPHTGTDIPDDYADGLKSLWMARRDADWWIDRLYDFTADLDATIIHTAISRTVIDVNRDPSGVSLYPGQATTELCPTTSFDGEPLYEPDLEPSAEDIAGRVARFHAPYQAALKAEAGRLRALHPAIVVYDCHSIRSVIPRLFDGELPQFNIGTNDDRACAPELTQTVARVTAASGLTTVTNGRFKGGHITRSLGDPANGVHAIQMELACRGYMAEPNDPPTPETWPSPYDGDEPTPGRASAMRVHLKAALAACLAFAETAARDGAIRP